MKIPKKFLKSFEKGVDKFLFLCYNLDTVKGTGLPT